MRGRAANSRMTPEHSRSAPRTPSGRASKIGHDRRSSPARRRRRARALSLAPVRMSRIVSMPSGPLRQVAEGVAAEEGPGELTRRSQTAACRGRGRMGPEAEQRHGPYDLNPAPPSDRPQEKREHADAAGVQRPSGTAMSWNDARDDRQQQAGHTTAAEARSGAPCRRRPPRSAKRQRSRPLGRAGQRPIKHGPVARASLPAAASTGRRGRGLRDRRGRQRPEPRQRDGRCGHQETSP